MSQDKRRPEKRKQILRAGLTIFAEKGFHESKVDEIARRAEVGKGTVYEYFSHKEGLFQEVIRSNVDQYVDLLNDELQKQGTACEKVRRTYRRYYQIVTSNTDIKKVIGNEFGKIPEELHRWIHERFNQLVDSMEKVMEAAMANGQVLSIPPRVAAFHVLNSMKTMHFYMDDPDFPIRADVESKSMDDVVDEQLEMIWNGLLRK